MKILVSAAIILAALTAVLLYGIDNAPRIIDAQDRNVPGKTTGPGRNSLLTPAQ